MNNGVLEQMRNRASAVKTRATIRSWTYRQRNLAAGVWFRLRRVLARAEAAYEISSEDGRRLVAEGYRPEICGGQLEPAKTILFVDTPRLAKVESRRPIPVRLGQDFMAAEAVALIAFDR